MTKEISFTDWRIVILLESERLFERSFKQEDLEPFHGLMSLDVAQKYTSDGIPEIEWILPLDQWGRGYSTEIGCETHLDLLLCRGSVIWRKD